MRILFLVMLTYFFNVCAMENKPKCKGSLSLAVKDGTVKIPKNYVQEIKVFTVCKPDNIYFKQFSCEEIKLLRGAFDAVKQGSFKKFLVPLYAEYLDECRLSKHLRHEKLTRLLSVAEKLQVRLLSALCWQSLVPQELSAKFSWHGKKLCAMQSEIDNYIISHNVEWSPSVAAGVYGHYYTSNSIISSSGLKSAYYDGEVLSVCDENKDYTALEVSFRVESLSFSWDGNFLAAGKPDGVVVWNLATNTVQPVFLQNPAKEYCRKIFALNNDGSKIAANVIQNSPGSVSVHFHDDGTITVTNISGELFSSVIRVYDVKDGAIVYEFYLDDKQVSGLVIEENDNLLCFVSSRIYSFDLRSGQRVLDKLDYAHFILFDELCCALEGSPQQKMILKKGTIKHAIYRTLPSIIKQWMMRYIQAKATKENKLNLLRQQLLKKIKKVPAD